MLHFLHAIGQFSFNTYRTSDVRQFPYRSCQSYTVTFPSQLWALNWAHVSSTSLWWTDPSDSGAPHDQEHWQPGVRRTCRWGHCHAHCPSPETASSLSRGRGRGEDLCCPTPHLIKGQREHTVMSNKPGERNALEISWSPQMSFHVFWISQI